MCVHSGETLSQKIKILHQIHVFIIHPHTPSAVGILIGHMLFTHFSIYPYLNFFWAKNALKVAIYCAES
ncbi:hypothetical protein DA718_04025 [Klebsiella huaxiensis]|nr:hypothetical protein DA718_04025 [Klebsiella huaxiensis]